MSLTQSVIRLVAGGIGLFALLGGAAGAQQPCELAKLVPSDGGTGAAAISGDYVVVGDPSDSDLGFLAGAAYIFKREGTKWVEQVKLTASDGGGNEVFGGAVAIDGDIAVIGAIGLTDFGGDGFGAAYVFRREGTDWVEEAKLISSGSAFGDMLGFSVAIAGDLIVVGAPVNATHSVDLPRVYVFRYDGLNWVEEAALVGWDTESGDFFGAAVRAGSDLLVAGAPLDDHAATEAGSAHVFRREGATWAQEAKIVASDPEFKDRFGFSVSISSDSIAVGAANNDDAGTNSGSAYVFRGSAGKWVEETKLTASDGAGLDRFGVAVAIHGDLVIAGANGDDDAGENSGSAYLFEREGAAWVERYKLLASDAGPGRIFGFSVSMDIGYAVVGAASKAYVFGVAGDCNQNGTADPCDIADGTSEDMDCDGVPDECGMSDAEDCNNNMVPDLCDIADGTSEDRNGNGIPDECDPPQISIPMLPQWGLVIMGLLFILGAKICFGRRISFSGISEVLTGR